MRASIHDDIRRCIKRYVLTDRSLVERRPLHVAELTADDRGECQPLFGFSPTEFHLVSTIGSGPHDVLVSTQSVAAVGDVDALVDAVATHCAEDGIAIFVTPDPDRSTPTDFIADAALARGLVVVENTRDARGPSYNIVTVVRRRAADAISSDFDVSAYMPQLDGALQNDSTPSAPAHEQRRGTMKKNAFLRRLHTELQPRGYLEIGVNRGASLALTRCPAVGIDPAPQVSTPLEPFQHVHRSLSADFFADPALVAAAGDLDLAYIDGMHLIENAFEDFVNVERASNPTSIILVDDIFPNHARQALRSRASRLWAGDVWKIIDILRARRPDLVLIPLDTLPTGTLMVLGARPDDPTLFDAFDTIIDEAIAATQTPPDAILERRGSVDPSDPLLWKIVAAMREARSSGDHSLDAARALATTIPADRVPDRNARGDGRSAHQSTPESTAAAATTTAATQPSRATPTPAPSGLRRVAQALPAPVRSAVKKLLGRG
jgi:predicted O-methyltransferase YrrM